MTVPVWMLLGFATWTLLLLVATVGMYRWSRILMGRAAIASFPADRVEGADWYRRAMRAHANCVENLPVFGAIVFALHAAGIESTTVNTICEAVLAARLLQSLTHISVPQTNGAVAVRFTFFSLQIACFFWLVAIIVFAALGR